MAGSVAPEIADFSVVLCASLPPPITGQCVATTLLLGYLEEAQVPYGVVNLSEPLGSPDRSLPRLVRGLEVISFPFRLLREIRRARRPTVVYLQLGQSHRSMIRDLPLLAIGRALSLPTVVHVHGGGFGPESLRAPTWLRSATVSALRRVNGVIVLSPRLGEPFRDFLPADRVSVIPNGVEPAVATAAEAATRTAARAPSVTALFLSNLMVEKGYADVLHAARLAQERGLPHRFVIAGAETASTRIDPRQFVQRNELTNVDCVGAVDTARKLELLSDADVLLLPTRMPEGQPIAVLEAMHFGLPVVTTAAGGLAELVHHERHGLIVGPEDPEAILLALERLAAEPKLRQSIAEHNRAEARRRYTAQQHGRSVVCVLGQAARAGALS